MTTPRDALEPILRAGPGALARCRLIDVACRADHRLLQVIQTGHGPVMLFRPGSELVITDAVPADDLDGAGLPGPLVSGRYNQQVRWFQPLGHVEAWCGCGVAWVDLAWLAGQETAGRRRVIHDTGTETR